MALHKAGEEVSSGILVAAGRSLRAARTEAMHSKSLAEPSAGNRWIEARSLEGEGKIPVGLAGMPEAGRLVAGGRKSSGC